MKKEEIMVTSLIMIMCATSYVMGCFTPNICDRVKSTIRRIKSKRDLKATTNKN